MRVVALAGGTGAAKLLRGLATCVSPHDLAVIGNTGDDTDVWGLSISPDLEAVVMKCLARKPESRYQRMSELAEALRKVVEKRP